MNTCQRCYNSHNEPGDYCTQCARDLERGYQVLSKTGRRANGAELGHGILFHVVPVGSYKALCGTEPGRRADWSSWKPSDQVTCQKCLKKLQDFKKD